MISHECAKILLSIKAVTLDAKKPYRYASGILSPIYCDNRLLMSYPQKRKKVVDFFLAKIEDIGLDFDIIAGTATAGIPHAAWIADRLDKPMIYIRGRSKDHGKENRIEGKLKEGQKVLVIEDLVSTGGSSVSAVEAVMETGGSVVACLAIFTYGMEKAKKRFEEAGCPLYTLSDFSTLIEVAEKEGYLGPEEAKMVKEWNKAPAEWGKRVGFE